MGSAPAFGASHHPLPASPIKGEVPPCGCGGMVPKGWSAHLPLDGGGWEGVGPHPLTFR
jgi:hypothetical protein